MTPEPTAFLVRTTLTACITLVSLPAQEIPVPEFDTAKAKASYVLSKPTKLDPNKAYPLILDYHGAAAPSRKGANITAANVWQAFTKKVDCIVVGVNGRTRAWGMTKGKHDDIAYGLHVLKLVQGQYRIAKDRIYLAGFSSGSDFLCKSGIQNKGPFAGSLCVCPGPSSVLGLRGGELLRAKDKPFFFLTGEEDYIRKDGSWQAFVALEKAKGRVLSREVPRVGHRFPPQKEYVRAFELLEAMARNWEQVDRRALARDAVQREDYLLATCLLRMPGGKADRSLLQIEATGMELTERLGKQMFDSPGQAYEAWWRVLTQFHHSGSRRRARKELDAIAKKTPRRDLYRSLRDWFRNRGSGDGNKRPPRKTGEAVPRRQPVARTRSRLARPFKHSGTGPFAFDRYLSASEIETRLKLIAKQRPDRVNLVSMGKSIQGRDLWVLEITNHTTGDARKRPAAYIQGAIHGNEASAAMVTFYMAWQLGLNPDRRRGIERLLGRYTVYIAPVVSPDSLESFVTKPNTMWRPRFNMRPHDADRDGKQDEDGYEDLNGDGQISHMYKQDPNGPFILKDGKLVRGRNVPKGTPHYKHVGREGKDDDGDGRYSEDPVGGVNLNRNFPVGFAKRRDFEGFRGDGPGSEPETKAIMKFVTAHPNIALFLDYHNAAKCVFYMAKEDATLHQAFASRARKALGYLSRPLNHSGVGLSIAWSYGKRGIVSAIMELEPGVTTEKLYFEAAWENDVFVPAVQFKHPQLGQILLGNDWKKLPKRNPHPKDIVWQARRNCDFLRKEMFELPRLSLEDPKIEKDGNGFVVTGHVANIGRMPMATKKAKALQIARPIEISAEGATLAGDQQLPALDAGGRAPFKVRLSACTKSVTLVARHPKGGEVRLEVARPRVETVTVRKQYDTKDGYGLPDELASVVLAKDSGPRFTVPHQKNTLRVAVLLGEFTDNKRRLTAQQIEQAYFSRKSYSATPTGQHAYGSVRDFYQEMSYKTHDITGKVFPWVTVPGNYEDYRKASFGSSKFRDALERLTLTQHGKDALNGYDCIVYVWAGNPVHRVSCLWPMRLNLKHRPGVIAFKTGEFYRAQAAAIGVACHEMGHTFGVNDKYGLGAPKRPLGKWCLMCKGTHGAGNSARHRPFHQCAWCKMVIGWVKPTVLAPTKEPKKLALRAITFGPRECYRILLKPDGSEYLLLENRQREGFFTEIPSAGLVVLRVGPNNRPSAPQKQVQLLPAHGLPPVSSNDLARRGEVAWPQKGKAELTVDGVRLSDIHMKDGVVYFTLSRVE